MKASKLILYLAILSLFLIPVFAQTAGPAFPGDWFGFLSEKTGIPEKYLAFPNFLYYVVAPFVATAAVMFGILNELRLFRRAEKVNVILSISSAFVMLGMGWMWTIVQFFLGFGVVFTAITVGIVAILGVAMWGHSNGSSKLSYFSGRSAFKSADRGIIGLDEDIIKDEKVIQSLHQKLQGKNIPVLKQEIRSKQDQMKLKEQELEKLSKIAHHDPKDLSRVNEEIEKIASEVVVLEKQIKDIEETEDQITRINTDIQRKKETKEKLERERQTADEKIKSATRSIS